MLRVHSSKISNSLLAWTFALLPVCAQTPAVLDKGVVNSVTQDRAQAIAAGSIVSIFGSELASGAAMADSVPLSTSIAGISVTFNDKPAAIRQVSPTLISVQAPWDLTGESATVVVTRNGVASEARTVPLAAYSPGIYAISNLGISNLALAMNSDGTLAQPEGAIPGLNSRPARFGETVVILATGLGPVDPPAPAVGEASKDVVRNVLNLPQVMVGSAAATVQTATLAANNPGVYHVAVTIPDTAPVGGAIPLQLEIGGFTSPNTTTMAVAMPPPATE
jgi:uncharacterized protein (TIGR03437 family)